MLIKVRAKTAKATPLQIIIFGGNSEVKNATTMAKPKAAIPNKENPSFGDMDGDELLVDTLSEPILLLGASDKFKC